MSTVSANLHVKDENGNLYDVHPTTTIANVAGLQTALDGKVNTVSGKGLSTNDYTTNEKNKLSGIEAQANKTTVDSALSSSSTNPVQNKIVKAALDTKFDTANVSTSVPESPTNTTVPSMKLVADTYAPNSSLVAITSRVSQAETDIATQTARIDAIASLPSGSTSGDAELMDIRVKADGAASNSAGDAVRQQISSVMSNVEASNLNLNTVVMGDLKNSDYFNYVGQNVTNTDNIWFQYRTPNLSDKALAHNLPVKINRIKFIAKQGTINFYKVNYNEATNAIVDSTLLTSVTNTASEEGKFKEVDITETQLGFNDYIGVNGSFCFKAIAASDPGFKGYVSRSFNVSSRSVTNRAYQVLGFSAYHSESHEERLSILENSIDSLTETVSKAKFAYDEYVLNNADEKVNNNTSYLWIPIRDDCAKPIHIDRIRYKVVPAETINFYKVKLHNNKVEKYSLITSVTNAASDVEPLGSIKIINVDVDLKTDEFIAVNGSFFFSGTQLKSGYYGYTYTLSNGNVSINPQIFGLSAESINSVEERIETLENEFKPTSRIGEVVLYSHKFATTDTDFEGNQNFNSYGLILSENQYIKLKKTYAASDRTVKFVCKFGANSKIAFKTVIENGNTNTQLDVNTELNRVSVVTPTLQYFFNTTDEYLISMSKHYLDLTIEITNINTGYTFKHTYEGSGTGGVGSGAVETADAFSIPMQHCYYGIVCQQGSVNVSQMIITAAKCDILLYGDSITEGEAYWPRKYFGSHWVQQLIKYAGGRAMASGRSGGQFTDILPRMQSEIPFIKPKYVMITCGTNGGATVENYTALVQYVKSQGCIPILNHIPCYNNNGNTTGFRTANANIDTVRQAENVNGADFDLATSLNHDGQNVDISTMWYETYSDNSYYYHHPNVKGSNAMFNRILIDVPEIFDPTSIE